MADGYISQIKLPNEETYDFRDRNLKVYTGSCSTAAGTAIKDVTTDGAFTLAKGAVIFVNFSVTNSAAVGNLKLKINGEADANAKPIKYLVNGNDPANIPGAGYLRANQTYMFRYDGTNWVADLNYYTYSNDFANKIGHYNNILARKAIAAESLIVGDETGYEKVASGVTFNLAYPIVWCTGAVNANASNYANMFLQHYDRNIATGAKSGFTSTANKVIYLIVTINGNIATIDSNIITDTLPSSDDGKVYISLGKLGAQSTGANYFFLYPVHPMFWYKNGAIREYGGGSGIKDITRSGTTFTATRDDGSTFTFTQQDTNKYHKSGSWSGLTYTATAVNSADELKFTIPNKIQTNWELNAASGNSPALLFTRDGSLTDWKIFVTSGKLSFQSATDGSTWTERAYFKDNSGDFVATSFTGKGSDLTDLNGSNISSGTVAFARLPMGNANTALMGKGSSTAPAYVSVSPSISITAGTADNAPKVNLTVLGVSGTTAQELTKATTGVYGATKLYDGVDSTSTTLAATANAVKTAYDKAAGIVAAADAMVFKGTLDGAASTKYTPAADRGHTYKVAVAGLINGEPVEVGDILICTTDSTAAATSSNVNTIKANWVIIQNNVDGAVFYGSNSLSNGQYLVADGANGKVKSQALPTASTTTAGITTVGASGGAAAYSHGTHVSYGTSTAKIGTAAAGTASTVSRSDHVHAIDLATGDSNGQVKIAGTNVTVKGLGDRAFDSTSYLPLGGGNMTGNINRYYSASSTEPMLKLSANNVNAYLFQIGHGGSAGSIAGNYYILKYMGAQDSPNNELQLISAVNTSTEKIAIKINENGVISFPQMNKGSSTKPVYFNAGVFTECTTYAGGTAVTLNGSSAAGSTAAFYAPTAIGSEGQVLKSQGTGAPAWEEEYKIEIVRLA